MSFAKRNRLRVGLRARLTSWTASMLAVSLAAGFAWVHHGLSQVLAAKNDAFLGRKAAELVAVVRDAPRGDWNDLEAEVRREVDAYAAEGLVVIVRRPGTVIVAPPSPAGRSLADRIASSGPGPRTVSLSGSTPRYRVVSTSLEPVASGALALGLSLAETEATLAQFDRRAAVGGVAFLLLAVFGGIVLSSQALRPVARSIRTARRLNPADLSARLPRTGSGDELDELAGTINDLLDRLAAYHGQVIRFTADASHELRSPLAAMRAAIDVALQQPRTAAEYQDTLGSMGEQCDRLTALVNGLLLLSRADAGEAELRQEPIDLAALADGVAEMFQPLAEERGIELIWDHQPALRVRGDPPRLRQLLTNLVDNAIKFTAAGGTVRVRVESAGDYARLVVTDTGEGIPAEHLPHVFERFYQADPARSSAGTGLGLSICRWIADAHGGSIRAESEPSRGSTFFVDLPRALEGHPGIPARASPAGAKRAGT
jgi:heavy metal sensor kinase